MNSCSSSSSEFGSFMLLASVDKYSPTTRKSSPLHALIMLSSVSGGYESETSSGDWPWIRHDDRQLDYVGGDDQVFKVEVVDNNLGGGGGGSANDQRRQLVLKLKYLGAPAAYESCLFFKQIIGSSSNGLLCLYDWLPNQVSLWNPATSEHRILPKPKHIGEYWNDSLFAFGFDVKTKDYKVVLITGFKSLYYRPRAPIECLCRIQVYSLSTDSWRLVEGITSLPGYPFLYQSEVIYLNGTCFFLAKFFHTRLQPCFPESDRFIISFDLTKEIITPIQLPDHHQDQKLYLSCLGEELALFTKSYHNGTCEKFNVWVLKEHGRSNSCSVNKDSWTKLHSFQIKLKIPSECNTPIGISNDGEFALLQTSVSAANFDKKIKLYHFASNQVKKNFLSCMASFHKAHAYEPSLDSVIGGKTAAAAAGGKGSS